MNEFVNLSQSSVTDKQRIQGPLNLDDATWWEKSLNPSDLNGKPLSPLSFAFLPEEAKTAFKFPESNLKSKVELQNDEANSNSNCNVSSKMSEENSASLNFSTTRKTFKVSDLLVVEDDTESPISSKGYEPKAYIGWASFGESIIPPAPPSPVKKETAQKQSKRKLYVIRSRYNEKPYQTFNSKAKKNSLNKTNPVKSKSSRLIETSKHVITDSDEDVDVVGIDEDEDTLKVAFETGHPPDLPPQRSLGSRFEFSRVKKDNRRNYESEDDDPMRPWPLQSLSPPPTLELQMNDSPDSSQDKIEVDSDIDLAEGGNEIEQSLEFDDFNPSQILKTKISSSTIPILPLSKSIMERKKVALGITKNAVIKKASTVKPTGKLFSVAPKSVQIPAYTDKAPMTFYSNFNKPLSFNRDARGRCVRCRDRSPVDMSSFKFIDDSTSVSIRAHLCDQTRVMIARTAIWNREYAKRLGDRAVGTIWQKPDEVTSQMTGFCSATVRRCIEIANVSIVPRCADRIGVSKNELASLKTSFGNEKFCGQNLKNPHVLTQYYTAKPPSSSVSKASSSSDSPSSSLMNGLPTKLKPEEQAKIEEEERKHHPFTYPHSSTSINEDLSPASSQQPIIPPLKKPVLRWTSISTNKTRATTLKANPPFSLPRTAVIPVMKKKDVFEPHKKETPGAVVRKRGRPRKEITSTEKVKPAKASTRRLKSRKKDLTQTPVDLDVRDAVDSLVEEVSNKVDEHVSSVSNVA